MFVVGMPGDEYVQGCYAHGMAMSRGEADLGSG